MEWLIMMKIPKTVASALISVMLFGIISLGATFLTQPAISWIKDAPENFQQIEKKFRSIKISLGEINKAAESVQAMAEPNQKMVVKIANTNSSLAPSIFNFTSSVLFLVVTIQILLFFFLIYFKEFIQNLEKNIFNKRKSPLDNLFVLHLKNEVSTYIFTFSLICMTLGLIMALVFWLLGLPNFVLWGVMVMLLTFIPYLGHLTGIIIILFVSLITFDSYLQILAPPILYLLFAVLEGQFITPIFLGNRLNLNPLILFLNFFILSWMWGISGGIIAVPLLITFKLVLRYTPFLSKYQSLLE
jgi:predicted PurR-regulated permease PerM